MLLVMLLREGGIQGRDSQGYLGNRWEDTDHRTAGLLTGDLDQQRDFP